MEKLCYRKSLSSWKCLLIIPFLYEKVYVTGLEICTLHWAVMLYTAFQYYSQNWLELTFLFLTHSFFTVSFQKDFNKINRQGEFWRAKGEERSIPVSTERQLNVHKAFKTSSERLMYIQFTSCAYEVVKLCYKIQEYEWRLWEIWTDHVTFSSGHWTSDRPLLRALML